MHKGRAAIHCGRSDDALVVVATGRLSTFGRNKLRTSRAMYDGEGEV